MPEKYGVKETQELLDGTLDYGNLVAACLEDDGKISKADFGKVLAAVPGLAMSTYKAIEGLDKLPQELEDLSEEEAAQLVANTVSKFGWSSKKAQKIVKHALLVAAHTGLMVKAIVEPEDQAALPEAPVQA